MSYSFLIQDNCHKKRGFSMFMDSRQFILIIILISNLKELKLLIIMKTEHCTKVTGLRKRWHRGLLRQITKLHFRTICNYYIKCLFDSSIFKRADKLTEQPQLRCPLPPSGDIPKCSNAKTKLLLTVESAKLAGLKKKKSKLKLTTHYCICDMLVHCIFL